MFVFGLAPLARARAEPVGPEVKVGASEGDQISVNRGNSPWQGYTGSHDEEQRGKLVRAVKIAAEYERPRHLERYCMGGEPLLAIDRKRRRVVVNEKYLSDIRRPDATRIGAGERLALGTVKARALLSRPKDLTRFLLESELIETYAHLESELRIIEEDDRPSTYRAAVKGHHVYYTHEEHRAPLSFAVEIDRRTGEVTVLGQ